MSNILSKLLVTKETKNDNQEIQYQQDEIPIGVNSNNVIISDSNDNFSLTQLYTYLKTFFNSKMFVWYGNNIPDNDNIIEYYQVINN